MLLFLDVVLCMCLVCQCSLPYIPPVVLVIFDDYDDACCGETEDECGGDDYDDVDGETR